jgi:integrase
VATKRKGNGEGSVTLRKDGRWVARFTAADGTRRPLYAKTRAEASRKLRAAMKQNDEGTLPVAGKRSVEQFLNAWLAGVESTLQPTTFRRYEQYMRNQAIPAIGKVQLKSLTPEHLTHLYKVHLDDGLSPTTVGHLHTALHTALSQAVKWNYVPRNVAGLAKKPKPARNEMKTLNEDEALRLLDAARADRFEALYVLALTTGLRQGELLALRWRDVHLDRAVLQVRGTLQPTREGLKIAAPKTKSSANERRLAPVAIDAIRRHKIAQNAERLRLGEAWEDNDFVFANEVGRPVSASNLRARSFIPLLKKAHVPTVRFHDLRHTAATLMLEKNVHPKIVSAMLGHSSIAITLDTYSHVTKTAYDQATASMEEIFGGGRRSS